MATGLSRRMFLAATMALPACGPLRESKGAGLARKLVAMYAVRGRDAERWGGRGPTVEIGGVVVLRRVAYRDDLLFPSACAALLENSNLDDARLGAWLLEGTSPAGRKEAMGVARAYLKHKDPVTRFHILKSLLELGDLKTVAAATEGSRVPHEIGLHRLTAALPGSASAPEFMPGACFWYEGQEGDFGAAQFEKLARFGVCEVSFHTFDPLQQGKHNPVLREGRRFGLSNLAPWVQAAKRSSIAVTFKPHLEMGFRRLTDAERKILTEAGEGEKRGLRASLDQERAEAGWHGEIEMKSLADWRRWFEGYAAYLLEHARSAALAGVSTFCVGRELDRTVLGAESLWRALIRDVRSVFPGRLVYSAHHDTFDRLPFWDALDVIGVSAYPQVSHNVPPVMAEVEAGWGTFVTRCDAASSRVRRPVAWTEVGYPAVDTAAGEPWRENTSEANVILQSDLLATALSAARAGSSIRGSCVWLWEGVSDPPFRDRSFTVQDKPAAFAMAGVYQGFRTGR